MGLWRLLLFGIGGSLLAGGCSSSGRATSTVNRVPSEKPANPPVVDGSDPSRLDPEVLTLVRDATVLIGNFEGGTLTSTGSGFVVGDGKRIVTNKHVVTGTDDLVDPLKLVFWSGSDKARIVQVKPDAVSLYGTLGRTDKDYHKEDLAFIKIGAVVSEPVKVAEVDDLQETMPVWGFGFPRGTNMRTGFDMPSATIHTLRVERIERQKDVITMLQLSGSPTYGNSGGPVVDREGKVLGVLQAKTPEAPILFAIPSVRVAKMLSGKPASSKSIAELWRAPMETGSSKANAVVTNIDPPGDRGPRQTYASVLNSTYLTESDLEDMSPMQLTLLRNEPFARRGYIFKRPELRRAFASFPWYAPRTRNLNAVQRLLTRREARNVDFIKSYQRSTGQDY